MATPLKLVEPIFLPVRNLEAAGAWYQDKLGCKREPGAEDSPDMLVLSFGWIPFLTLALIDPDDTATLSGSSEEAIFFTDHIEKARDFLTSRKVAVTPIQRDRQGTQYFEFHDLDGNLLEVSEAP